MHDVYVRCQVTLKDTSTNGVYVNGKLVGKNRVVTLQVGLPVCVSPCMFVIVGLCDGQDGGEEEVFSCCH
jgi:hypothetical protein